jgi:hypothetical protein
VLAQLKVISREYKIMLNAERFQGDEEQLLKQAAVFWNDFSTAVQDDVLNSRGDLKKIRKSKRRLITFYDTEEQLLNNGSYVFRERRRVDNGSRQVTLKFRHLDRYISQGRDMAAGSSAGAESKFEEDIKPEFTKLYSHSTSITEPDTQEFNNLGDIAGLFPGLKKGLKSYKAKTPLSLLNGLEARELVITGAELKIGKKPGVKAECALVSWYDDACDLEKPLVVEFSFRYRDECECYGVKAARRAFDAFETLQKLAAWIDPDSKTKTKYAYCYSGCAGS